MSNQSIYAAFVLAPCGFKYAATTRSDGSGIGLPGGKLEEGETPRQAAMRESYEKGWQICGLYKDPFTTQIIEGKRIACFLATTAVKLVSFEEQGRILPVEASEEEIISSGRGNENIFSTRNKKDSAQIMYEAEEEDKLMIQVSILEDRIKKLNEENSFLAQNFKNCNSELARERDKASCFKMKSEALEDEVERYKEDAEFFWEKSKYFEEEVRSLARENDILADKNHQLLGELEGRF